MTKPSISPALFASERPHRIYLELRVRRSVLIAGILSLLVHVALLLFLPQLPPQSTERGVQGGTSSLVVQLSLPDEPALPQRTVVPIRPAKATTTKPHKTTPARVKTTSSKPVIATNQSNATFTVPKPASVAAQPTLPKLNPGDFSDMQSYIAAQRIAAGGADSSATPSVAQTRDETIKRNLKSGGTNGVFSILRMDSYTAEFSFRGWTNDYSNARREVIQVEKGSSVDIEHAIIQKMIDLIRRYYKGDFQWDSQRLHRVVTLSARVSDNAGLEDFMIREFFQGDGQLRTQ